MEESWLTNEKNLPISLDLWNIAISYNWIKDYNIDALEITNNLNQVN